MSRFLVNPNDISEHQVVLSEKETHHIKNVLRFNSGDRVVVFDGKGNEYLCQIKALDKKQAVLEIVKKTKVLPTEKTKVCLAHCVTKGERFDWVVEKGTELGVAEIVPFISERINVKLNQENKIKKQQRWQRLAEAASKQCGRIQLPKVGEILSFQDLIQSFSRFDLVLLAYELESGTDLKRSLRKSFKENKLKSILAVVGPEGGFSAAEVKAMQQVGAQSVSLGKNILRTETAAISMLAMMQYELLS